MIIFIPQNIVCEVLTIKNCGTINDCGSASNRKRRHDMLFFIFG